MAKNELKTKKNAASVSDFLAGIDDEEQRADCIEISNIMEAVSGAKPMMWGASIVGFGNYHYKYASGREGDWMRIGFSPRKGKISLYLCSGLEPHQALLADLGQHDTGKGCLYIKCLQDVKKETLKKLIKASYEMPAAGEV